MLMSTVRWTPIKSSYCAPRVTDAAFRLMNSHLVNHCNDIGRHFFYNQKDEMVRKDQKKYSFQDEAIGRSVN